jgi:hypothetical protein
LIPQRIELRTHPYQKYALPIKLRNQTSLYCKIYYILNKFKFLLNKQAFLFKRKYYCNYVIVYEYKIDKSTQTRTEKVKFEASNFTIKLCSLYYYHLLNH